MRPLQWQSEQPIRDQRPKTQGPGGTAGFAPKCGLWLWLWLLLLEATAGDCGLEGPGGSRGGAGDWGRRWGSGPGVLLVLGLGCCCACSFLRLASWVLRLACFLLVGLPLAPCAQVSLRCSVFLAWCCLRVACCVLCLAAPGTCQPAMPARLDKASSEQRRGPHGRLRKAAAGEQRQRRLCWQRGHGFSNFFFSSLI
jgi:hypothetical protein